MKKYLAAAGIASIVGAAGLTTVGVVHAASTTASATDPMSSLVDALASKFNLNKSDVQSVFDDQRAKMDEQRETRMKSEVAQLVTDGKLTQDQADKINAKRAELQKEREAHRDSFKDMMPDERRTEMEKHRTELETWAKENGIDTTYLRYVAGGGHGPGRGGMGMMHGDDSSASSSQSN